MDIDKRRAEMVRLAAAVRERLSEPARLNDVSIVLSDDAAQQVLELTNHVTAIDSMLSEGQSTFPLAWQNDGTLGHDSFRERVAEGLAAVLADDGVGLLGEHYELLAALKAEAACPRPPTGDVLHAAEERGRVAGLEQAAKVAEAQGERKSFTLIQWVPREIAAAIRSLIGGAK